MIAWQRDKQTSDKYIPHIKEILGRHLIGVASMDEDQERNTDLIVMTLKSVRIACRVRTEDYFRRYPNEFTIRSGRPSGTKTELSKVIEGWGDYIFYGFGSNDTAKIIAYTLGDLRAFRAEYCRKLYMNGPKVDPGIRKSNRDGSSSFHAFNWSDYKSMVVAQEGFEVPA